MLDCHLISLAQAELRLRHASVWLDLWQLPNGLRFLQASAEGHFEIGDLSRIFQLIDESPSFDIALPTLWDMRDFNWSAQSAPDFRASLFALQHFPKRRNSRRGVLVACQIGYGMARMYQEAAATYHIENANAFRISYSLGELMLWLSDA